MQQQRQNAETVASLPDVLIDEYRDLGRNIPRPPDGQGNESQRLDAIYREIHAQPDALAALCISGGGIRSATFALGAVQELARRRLLRSFDYLSTVSGGGYIGSWLSAWIQRAGGVEAVEDSLNSHSGRLPDSPEADPVQHLREYNNYLTPRLGFGSPDTWTLMTIVSRNLLLNWLVFIPVLLLITLLPRLMVSLLLFDMPGKGDPFSGFIYVEWALLVIAFVLYWVASLNTFRFLPGVGNRQRTVGQFAAGVLGPTAGCSVIFALDSWWMLADLDLKPELSQLVFAGILVLFSSWLFYLWTVGRKHSGKSFRQLLLGPLSFAVLIAGIATGAAAYVTTHPATDSLHAAQNVLAYAAFAPPLLMLGLVLGGVAFVGLTSRALSDEDREWFSRSGAYHMMFVAGWLGVCWLVLVAPVLIFRAEAWLQATIASAGGISGLVTALAGHSAKASGNGGDGPPTVSSRIMELAAKLALPVFLLLLIVGLSVLSNWMMVSLLAVDVDWRKHTDVLAATPFGAVTVLMFLLSCFCWLMGRFVNINKFSLHGMYRNRLVRAYLAASNTNRKPNPFTGFDPNDNIAMHQLRGQRPLHVVNTALNLVGGKRLAWQQRKAESFTVTPLHSGNLELGYRDSAVYGGGITLGTAMAISGAAASPNMGYHSSPLISFTMMLFNARLGAWLGNPGPPGEKAWRDSGPRSAVSSMVREALGRTDDSGEYVYLSDGGHFENLALYEMIVRRCHAIFLLDSGCDPDYTYEDLGNALRKIRIDLKVPIEFDELQFAALHRRQARYAVARIRYTAIDRNAADGHLVYVKPMLLGTEPPDVLSYAASSKTFPHETTNDQWFTEAQTESYRALAQQTVGDMCEGFDGGSIEELVQFLAQPKARAAGATD